MWHGDVGRHDVVERPAPDVDLDRGEARVSDAGELGGESPRMAAIDATAVSRWNGRFPLSSS